MTVKTRKEERIKKTCKYCGRNYTYSKLLGDINYSACGRPRCVLMSMRDHI